ncbi:putative peptidase [Posidoniimonas polymericola]|uniref:Putative peptidase n=1 Tax=Posidoniimonas polymericola TaxID=2528002 RepID=A0A5C5ZGN8_9BACT|nr:Xaa-Pro peptidase family protein [Posidoniimonas polymericola]TWT85723.1 putative peptidase [Posidoniimonas polymericola]
MSQPTPIAPAEYQLRLAKAQRLLAEHNLDALLLPAGTSLRYFTGVAWGLSERFLGAVLPREGELVYVAPAFEEPKVRELLVLDGPLAVWEEHDSPFELVARLLKEQNAGRVAVEGTTPFFMGEALRQAAPSVELVDAAPVVDGCRMQKSAAEVAIIEHAMGVTLDIHRRVRDRLAVGVTNTEIARWIDAEHRAAGADNGSTFAIVAFGESTAFPHGPKGEQRLAEGDTVLVDTGCTFDGYHSDLTRTYVFGEPTARQRQIWEIEREAQAAAFAAAQPGAPCEAVDAAARAVLERHGLGPDYQTPGLPHRTGHGLGMDIHEAPYLVRGNQTPLAEGMVGSIEPMICVYGELGVRLEDHFVVTPAGPRWLSEPSASLDRPFG